ncbi:MAG: response regulator with CheY-like receiver domain and winged-helix DNA-binding domain [Ignavibacteria bacterium]|nr:response regulator with CheY-like receiver domain and winged-helix DNA-binding domain [Ignavibacteria bacterium]
MEKILIIEDEPDTRDNLVIQNEIFGYKAIAAEKGLEGFELFKKEEPDLIILDMKLPDIDGRDIIRLIRELSDVPIIVITGREALTEHSIVLDLGADYFLPKPWFLETLRSVINNLLQKRNSTGKVLRAGNLCIDYDAHNVKVKDEEIKLTVQQYKILEILAVNRGKLMMYDEILDFLCEKGYSCDKDNLKVAVHYIRQKIERAGGNPESIECHRSEGYIF